MLLASSAVRISNWTDPAVVVEAHAWLREGVARSGRQVIGDITQPHVRSWSTVFRAATTGGDVFLKLCGPSQAHEPALTSVLIPLAPSLLPEVLATHPTRPWMLLADGGAQLRDVLAGPKLLDAWIQLLPRYAELQRATLGRETQLLAMGTPDRRLGGLAAQLAAVIEDERILGPLQDDPLAPTRPELRDLLPQVAAIAAELSAFGIGPTVQHDDLHDGNVLSSNGRLTVFDWGDACVTHPFLSVWIVRRSAAHRAHLPENDPVIARLVDAYLEAWTDLASIAALRRAAELAAQLGAVTRALCWYRVEMLTSDVLADEPSLPGALTTLRDVIAGGH